ncbi:UxaA family hydrolase [Sphingosinicella sp. BN140058]|uniref:UxaA family hydrolase n=1 Tax=Sphingosinicella sp. BN140058 TaxID=1892855 RepID=UPI0010117C4E|nr:UxaA family hydrolase [Sphingosinicella sp. BN140058]QAY76712.1 altronate hydrolase [Sphingosinicella sp. BN140058]
MTKPDGANSPGPDANPSPRLLLLDEGDNVLVCTRPIAAGDQFLIDGRLHAAQVAIPVGHKVARHALAAGDKVLKYGAPVGSANRPIAAGEWIHLHNLDSDYIPTHSRKTVGSGSGGP